MKKYKVVYANITGKAYNQKYKTGYFSKTGVKRMKKYEDKTGGILIRSINGKRRYSRYWRRQ